MDKFVPHNFDFYKRAIEKMFLIVDKNMTKRQFKLNPPQIRMLKELDSSNRDIILKARKEGISSLILAMFCVDFLTVDNVKCVVISHEDESTRRLLERAKYFLESMKETWPGELPYRLKFNSRKEMVNETRNSTFYIGTAGSRAFGRGDDIHNLHISELPFWPDQESMMLGVTNSVTPNGRIIIEGTANGIGDYFYKMVVRSREGNTAWRFHFIPWFEDPTNVMPWTFATELNQEEQDLINKYGLSREQIAWRRWKINEGNGDWSDPATWDKFNQENPATADEAFIVSGNPVWSPNLLKFYLSKTREPILRGDLIGYQPVTVDPNPKGFLKVFKEPNEFHTYAIGVDVATGASVNAESRERDASCAQVFDKTIYEQVAVWHGKVDPDRLGRELDRLGRYYNEALIGVERNAVGITPLVVLRDLNYPNLYYREQLGMMTDKITNELGWVTTQQSKESLIADATLLLRDKRLMIYDEQTLTEMMSFVRDPDGHAKAAKSAYDDRVMAFLICLRMLSKARMINNSNLIERDDMMSSGGFWMDGQFFNKQGMPVSPNDVSGNLYQGDEW